MINKILFICTIFIVFPIIGNACSMYKITKNEKTIVGNNEDWSSPNSQFWFESGQTGNYGVMYMGLMDNFAQGAINEKGLVFDGFANPELSIENSAGKLEIPIGTAIRTIMQTMTTVEEVKTYIEKIDLSSLSSSQVVFIDRSGTYLIVEGDALITGEEGEKAFSNFYYSQIKSEKDVNIPTFKKGMQFLKTSEGNSSIDYCSEVMQSLCNGSVFGTQYSTIYDLDLLKVRVYLFHDYSQFIELDLKNELQKDDHQIMIADLFPKTSIGYQHYQKYNNVENPTQFLEDLVKDAGQITEKEMQEMGFNDIINMIGYEWLKERNNAEAAIKVFEYGTTLIPSDADLFDSLGEAYFENKEHQKSKLNFEKSLALDPQNNNAVEFINKIKLTETGKTEIEQITATLIDYIEGSTNGQPDRLKKAFHPDLNLYYTRDGQLKTWSGEAYIKDTKEGQPTGEVGKIISIDYENNIGVAKVQIADKKGGTPYIDYFMLVKIEERWTIIHKMFTKRVNE